MTQTPIATQATHVITQDDLKTWLADYGFDIDSVADATVRLASSWTGRWDGAPAVHEVNAWLDITWYKTNGRGNKYVVGVGPDQMAATATATIPLSSFPRLAPADPRPDAT